MLIAMGAVTCERWLTRIPTMGATHSRSRLLRGPVHLRSVLFCRLGSLRLQWPAARLCPQTQRRSARRNRLGRAGQIRRRGSRFPSRRSASQPRHSCRQLRRAGCNRVVWTGLSSAAAHQHDELSMAAWLSVAAALRRSSSLDRRSNGPTTTSPAAASPATSPTPPASRTKRASTTPTSYVCGPPRQPWPVFWKDHERFG